MPLFFLFAEGVADADLVLLVTTRPTTGNTLAWAVACERDQWGRAIAGKFSIERILVRRKVEGKSLKSFPFCYLAWMGKKKEIGRKVSGDNYGLRASSYLPKVLSSSGQKQLVLAFQLLCQLPSSKDILNI